MRWLAPVAFVVACSSPATTPTPSVAPAPTPTPQPQPQPQPQAQPPPRISPHDVEDTPLNRELLAFCDAYLAAVKRRDADAILAMVADDYSEGAGTAETFDDVDRDTLARGLPKLLARLSEVEIEFLYLGITERDGVFEVEVEKNGTLVTDGHKTDLHTSVILRIRRTPEGLKFLSGL